MLTECDPTAAPWVTAQLTEAQQAGDVAACDKRAAGWVMTAEEIALLHGALDFVFANPARTPVPYPDGPPRDDLQGVSAPWQTASLHEALHAGDFAGDALAQRARWGDRAALAVLDGGPSVWEYFAYLDAYPARYPAGEPAAP